MFNLNDLPLVDSFYDAADLRRHVPLPADWLIYITDVRDSTKAIEAGRYKEVNVVGSSCILAALNAAHPEEILFTFGGDGATLIVPPSVDRAVAKSLLGVKKLAHEYFQLELRVGRVPVALVQQAGAPIKALRYRMGNTKPLAQLSGPGVGLAESWIKDSETSPRYEVAISDDITGPDLEGLECRWKPVPSLRGRTVTLLAMSLEQAPEAVAAFYQELLGMVSGPTHAPVGEGRLSLALLPSAYAAEAVSREGKGWRGAFYGLKAYAISQFASVFWSTVGRAYGKNYKSELVRQSDHCKFDGMLRLVGDFSDDEVTNLNAMLESYFQDRRAVYGIHLSSSALLTCLIFNRAQGDHLHFVDGSDGGYALAAKAMKQRVKQLAPFLNTAQN